MSYVGIVNWYRTGLLSEDPSKFQVTLIRLKDGVGMLGIRFALSRCKVLSQDWIGAEPNIFLAWSN